MPKRILLALSVIFLFSFVLPSHAVGQVATDAATSPLNKRQAVKDRRAEKKEALDASRSARKEEFKQKREEFKLKLQAIRDEKKQAVVERIDAKIATVNANRTARMSEAISRMRSVLEKIQEKGDAAKTEDKDTTTLDAAIATSETALENAQIAVDAQADKEYIVTIESDTTLKSTVGKTVKQLQQDLQDTHKLVVDAKQAVMNARKELAKLRGEKTEMSSPSSTTTP